MTPQRLLALVLLVLLIAVAQGIWGWGELLRPWTAMSPVGLTIAALGLLASYLLRAGRFRDFFFGAQDRVMLPVTRVMLQHNLLNNLLPMRTGELSFPWLAHRDLGLPTHRSIPGLLWLRLLDLHLLLGAAALVLSARLELGPAVALIGAWALLPLLGILPARAWRPAPEESRGAWRRWLDRAMASWPREPRVVLRSWAWTLANWGVKLAVFSWVLAQFGPADWAGALSGAVGGELTSVLPVHGPGGAGTYELGVGIGLRPFGVDWRTAGAMAINLHLFVLSGSALGGVLSLVLPARRVRAPGEATRPARQ